MSDPLAQIAVAEHHHLPVLRVVGEVDMSNVAAVSERLRAGASGASCVIVDLTELGFLDSQGLRMLQHFADELAARGAALVIVAPAAGIAGNILALTGMDKTLDVREALPD